MYQPAYPQYAQPYGTMQQYQQPSMPPQQMMPQATQAMQQLRGITGRVVGAPADITPQELPMDGSVAFFPTSDGKAIYARALNPDFTVSTMRYVPEPSGDDGADAAHEPTLADVMASLDDMRSMLEAVSAERQHKGGKPAKKGAADDPQ